MATIHQKKNEASSSSTSTSTSTVASTTPSGATSASCSKPSDPGSSSYSTFSLEQIGIRPFSLMFDDDEAEKAWNLTHLHRHIGLTSRYLFVAALFQGIFYWGDSIEMHAGMNAKSVVMDVSSNLAFIGLIRFILAVMTLLACFLVATGMLLPTQVTIWWMNICYGIPTLSLFYFARAVPSHWDCLFLIYGLTFFMLPKISPLNFIFGIVGAAVLNIIFIYISSFRLSLQQWLLSTCILVMITTLFSYMCYCSEKLSREKWLLRARLQQAKINFRIISSLSIQDDFQRAVSQPDPFHNVISGASGLVGGSSASQSSAAAGQASTARTDSNPLSFLADAIIGMVTMSDHRNSHRRAGRTELTRTSDRMSAPDDQTLTEDHSGHGVIDLRAVSPQWTGWSWYRNILGQTSFNSEDDIRSLEVISAAAAKAKATKVDANMDGDRDDREEEKRRHKEKRMSNFYRGVFAWALCYSMAYAFDIEEVNNSPAFALLMHTMGFSIFLVVFTQQIRWLALNGIVGLTMLWALNQAGIEQKWVVFSTHSIGYVVLVVVIVAMILVFGGVVFVWSHLLDFIKDILIKYPQVKLELSEDKVVESLIVAYLADLPKSALNSENVFEIYKEGGADEEDGRFQTVGGCIDSGTVTAVSAAAECVSARPASTCKTSKKRRSSANKGSVLATSPSSGSQGQAHHGGDNNTLNVDCCKPILSARRANVCYFCYSPNPALLIPACETWDNRIRQSIGEIATGVSGTSGGIKMCTPYTEAVARKEAALRRVDELQAEIEKMKVDVESKLFRASSEWKQALMAEKRQHEDEVQTILTDHNKQLTEVKRLYRAFKLQTEKAASHRDFVGHPEPAVLRTDEGKDMLGHRARQLDDKPLNKSSKSARADVRRPSNGAASGTSLASPAASAVTLPSPRQSAPDGTRASVKSGMGGISLAPKFGAKGGTTIKPVPDTSEVAVSTSTEIAASEKHDEISTFTSEVSATQLSCLQEESVQRSCEHCSNSRLPESGNVTENHESDVENIDEFGTNMALEQHLLQALESLLSGVE
jgi:hypothetical protein